MTLLDANCAVGQRMSPTPGELYHPTDLKGELKRVGIAEALVYHFFAKEGSPAIGNQRLMTEVIAHHSNLYPCWVLLPEGAGEMGPVDLLVAQMRQAEVKAVRMFPLFHSFQFNQRVCGSLLSILAKRRIPLIVDYEGQVGTGFNHWDDLAGVLAHYPNLPLILAEPTYSSQRDLYPLLAAFPNLYIDISLFCAHGGIEDLCARFGAERLIFGSGLPTRSAGPPLAMLFYAEINDADKANISGGNLRRLMSVLE